MKKGFVIFLIILSLGTIGYLFINKTQLPKEMSSLVNKNQTDSTFSPKAVSLNATFDIYTNGTKRVFTDSRYHNLSADVFLEKSAPNQVNVKKEGITWGDFFNTLPMELTKDCLVTGTKQTFCTGESGVLIFYINDIEDKDALDRIINQNDKLLVKFEK